MKNVLNDILYHILYCLCYIVSLLPLRVLYIIVDILFFPIVRYVACYRVALVKKNLSVSFPDKDQKWIDKTTNRFYHYLCDEFIECIKMMSMSRQTIMRRMVFENTEAMQECLDSGRDVALYLGHYGCWDWVTSIVLWVTDNRIAGQIYHPLENKAMDRLFLKIRSRWGSEGITMAETLRRLAKCRAEKQNWLIGFIADQVPFWNNIHHWLTFLNHPDTPVLTGTERVARKFHAAAFYLDIRRERRGYYVGRAVLLSDDCSKHNEWEVTDKYFQALEQNIKRQPHLWLWTHNRWKRTREEYALHIDPITKKMR